MEMELKKEELEIVSGGYYIYADENGRYFELSDKDGNLKYVCHNCGKPAYYGTVLLQRL